jgi:hypothetical protein
MVGVLRFELRVSWSQTRRDGQASLYPDVFGGTGRIRTYSVSMCEVYSPVPIRHLSSRPKLLAFVLLDDCSSAVPASPWVLHRQCHTATIFEGSDTHPSSPTTVDVAFRLVLESSLSELERTGLG